MRMEYYLIPFVTLIHCYSEQCFTNDRECVTYPHPNFKRYIWAAQVSCPGPGCTNTWTICTECNDGGMFAKPDAVYHHRRKFHESTNNRPIRALDDDDMGFNPFDRDDSEDAPMPSSHDIWKNDRTRLWDCIKSNCHEPEDFNEIFDRKESANYFETIHKKGTALTTLVSQCVTGTSSLADMIRPVDAEMIGRVAGFVEGESEGRQSELASVLDAVERSVASRVRAELGVENETIGTTLPFFQINVPTTPKRMRQLFRDRVRSFPNLLPHPEVYKEDEHASCRLKACIQDLLAHNKEIDFISEPVVPLTDDSSILLQLLANTKQGAKIYKCAAETSDGKSLPIWIVLWSDDFEPNTQAKQNRGGVWALCATIATPHSILNSDINTYVLAIGPKGACHKRVEETVMDELKDLSSGNSWFYHGGIKKMIKVYAQVYAVLQDSPERRLRNALLLATGSYSHLWGYAGDLEHMMPKLLSCDTCFKHLLANTDNVLPCQQCANFNLERTDILSFPPPDHWPWPESNELALLRLTYEILIKAVQESHDNFVDGTWSDKEATAYLKRHAINTEATDEIMEHAKNAKLWAKVCSERDDNPAAYEKLAEERAADPSAFEVWKSPPWWRRVNGDIDEHIDVIMHLIFLGVTKRTNQEIHEWCTMRRRGTAFSTYANGILESVQKLQLDNFKVLPYREGTLGGWISENHLGWLRVSKWMYGNLDMLAEDPVFVEPDPAVRTVENWTMVHNRGWLRARGLPTTGNAAELKARVHEYRNPHRTGGVPPILPPRGGSVNSVKQVVVSLVAMVSRAMVEEASEEAVLDLERHVKIFLNVLENFDKGKRAHLARNTHLIADVSNYICLLRVPENMKRFGPLRCLWEGSGMGEGILRRLKYLVSGLTGNWASNTLTRFLRRKAYELVMGLFGFEEDDEEDPDEESIRERYRTFHQYTDLTEITSSFNKGEPLSVIGLADGQFGIIRKKFQRGGVTNEASFIPIQRGQFSEEVCGAAYFHWECMQPQPSNEHHVDWKSHIAHVCLLLPRLNGRGESAKDQTYYLITTKWLEMHADGHIKLPKGYIAGDNDCEEEYVM